MEPGIPGSPHVCHIKSVSNELRASNQTAVFAGSEPIGSEAQNVLKPGHLSDPRVQLRGGHLATALVGAQEAQLVGGCGEDRYIRSR